MTRRTTILARGAVLALAVAAGAGCYDDAVDVRTGPVARDTLFRSYVAIGNSITAGFQSGGINDSTQQQSYAALVAKRSFNTRYAYASLRMPGCVPPVANFVSGAVVGGTAGVCALRVDESVTDALNNVAVPGATSVDPTAETSAASNPLTTFILGGRTQVQRAAGARPTFVTAWIGNNDVLAAAVTGILSPSAAPVPSPGATSFATFQNNYSQMVTQLKAIPTIQGGALIGVVQVANAPILFPSAALAAPAFKGFIDQAVGGTVVIHPNCAGSSSLISARIIDFLRALPAGQRVIGCARNTVPGTPIGDAFVLDAAEQTTLRELIDSYNSFIQQQATSLGWAYYDPNPTLTRLRSSCITTPPNPESATPFGTCVSLDGVHPARPGHVAIANDLIAAINAKYGKSLPTVQ